jgi:hypothetical protein
MSWVGFEPTTPVFERATTDHVLDRVANVIDFKFKCSYLLLDYDEIFIIKSLWDYQMNKKSVLRFQYFLPMKSTIVRSVSLWYSTGLHGVSFKKIIFSSIKIKIKYLYII